MSWEVKAGDVCVRCGGQFRPFANGILHSCFTVEEMYAQVKELTRQRTEAEWKLAEMTRGRDSAVRLLEGADRVSSEALRLRIVAERERDEAKDNAEKLSALQALSLTQLNEARATIVCLEQIVAHPLEDYLQEHERMKRERDELLAKIVEHNALVDLLTHDDGQVEEYAERLLIELPAAKVVPDLSGNGNHAYAASEVYEWPPGGKKAECVHNFTISLPKYCLKCGKWEGG